MALSHSFSIMKNTTVSHSKHKSLSMYQAIKLFTFYVCAHFTSWKGLAMQSKLVANAIEQLLMPTLSKHGSHLDSQLSPSTINGYEKTQSYLRLRLRQLSTTFLCGLVGKFHPALSPFHVAEGLLSWEGSNFYFGVADHGFDWTPVCLSHVCGVIWIRRSLIGYLQGVSKQDQNSIAWSR